MQNIVIACLTRCAKLMKKGLFRSSCCILRRDQTRIDFAVRHCLRQAEISEIFLSKVFSGHLAGHWRCKSRR